MFKPVKRDLVSEAHPEFHQIASQNEKDAVKRAQQQSGIVSVNDPDWERKATFVQREKRRLETLRREKANDVEYAKTLGGEIRAKYKIEVMFEEGRTIAGPNLCGIQLWESGLKFHGGGDQLMYWCMDTDSNQGCKRPFSGDFIVGPVANCPNCGMTISMDRAASMQVVRLPTKALAEKVEKMFRSLKDNADIYVKFHKTDVHYLAMEKAKGRETAKRLKGMHIYPLKNIIKDTASGADLVGRIHAFLTA